MDSIAVTDIKRKKRREFSESELEDKLNAFGDIIGKILQVVLKISDLVDVSIQDLTSKVSNLQSQLNRINKDITTLKARFAGVTVSETLHGPEGPPQTALLPGSSVLPEEFISRPSSVIPEEFIPIPPPIVPFSPKIAWIPRKEYKIPGNEYRINEYITLKLEENKTFIYIKGKKFMQCIRLALQILPQESHLFEEVESIDEAAEVYKQYLWENKIVEGPMAHPSRFQNTTITPEHEFWGHCSNLQTWVEHKYDTRLLRGNLSFPLLKKLAKAGDELAREIFKDEIAQRLESGYPSVVQYLIIQGYLYHFTSSELNTIIDTTNLIKNVSSELKMLSNFLQTCADKFPRILGDIVLKILELPEGKENLITVSSRNAWDLDFRVPLDSNPQFLVKIKDALKEKLKKVKKDEKRTILDYIQIIDDNVNEKKRQIEAKNFEFEKAELNKIEKSLNLKTKEMHEEYQLMLLTPPPFSPLEFNKERRRLGVYLHSHLIPFSRNIRRFRDNLKMKLIELEKIKKKGRDVTKFINQANDLIRLNRKQHKKMISIRKDLYSKLINSVRKN